MQVKKNPKKDIRQWSLLFFQLGLVVILFISWRAIEKKSYERSDKGDTVIIQLSDDLDLEDIVVTEQPQLNTPPPPPPPKVPDKLVVVDDDEDIEEDEVESVEDVEQPRVEVADVGEIQAAPEEEPEEIEEVPFQAIQDVPIFPGCEKFKDNNKRKQCMSDGVQRFVNRRFNTDIGSDLGLTGITRISVQFTVDEHGKVTNIKTRAPEAALEDEARRVVSMLPEMVPGKQRDKPVRVIYSLPIVFQIQ